MLAALFIIVLYGVKSLTVFFPIVVLNIASGFLFEPFYAFAVNTIGIAVALTIPYCTAKLSGADFVKNLCEKYPKLREFLDGEDSSGFFMIFFLRVISCLPCDVVSMYFGAIKVPYLRYLTASYIGILPGMIAAMFIGENITDPSSPMFGCPWELRCFCRSSLRHCISYEKSAAKRNKTGTINSETVRLM